MSIDGTYRFTVDGDIERVSYETGYQVGTGNLFTGSLPYAESDCLGSQWLWSLLRDNEVTEFGIWTDNGVVYIDKCFHIYTEGMAFELAKAKGELAIWDWANGVCLEVK